MRTTMRYYDRDFEDQDFYGYKIRMDAHVLEKQLKGLFEGNTAILDQMNNISNELETCLKKYNGGDNTTHWERILNEYRKHLDTGWKCTLVGKVDEQDNGSAEKLMHILKSRRSIRHWSGSKVAPEKINLLVDAARWAPSSCNRQAWHFIVIDDERTIAETAKTIGGGREFFDNAPLLLLVVVDLRPYILPKEKYTIYQDAAAAIENLLIMAHSLNLGACWATYTSDSGAIGDEKEMRNMFCLPDHFKITGIIALGEPAESVCLIPRRAINEITSLNRYGNKYNGTSGTKK